MYRYIYYIFLYSILRIHTLLSLRSIYSNFIFNDCLYKHFLDYELYDILTITKRAHSIASLVFIANVFNNVHVKNHSLEEYMCFLHLDKQKSYFLSFPCTKSLPLLMRGLAPISIYLISPKYDNPIGLFSTKKK